jgi:hypothetical protein
LVEVNMINKSLIGAIDQEVVKGRLGVARIK